MDNCVGIVIICHSNEMTDNFIEFCKVLQQEEFPILNGGGKHYDTFGTTPEIVAKSIEKADTGKGVLVFVDLGNSIMNAIEAKKILGNKVRVEIADAPLVEGVISAVAANSPDMDIDILKQIAEESIKFKKLK